MGSLVVLLALRGCEDTKDRLVRCVDNLLPHLDREHRVAASSIARAPVHYREVIPAPDENSLTEYVRVGYH